MIFKLAPPKNGGAWTETVLYKFTGGADGGTAFAGVVVDRAGDLYGTTIAGAAGFGTVYKLSHTPRGTWKQTIVHTFSGTPDGATAYSTPILNAEGSLYGTTYSGGTANQGTVYEVSRVSGVWTEQVLCSFLGDTDGSDPFGGVILDRAGNVYGTTSEGGTARVGTAFELNAGNGWSKTILHQFLGLSARDGANPNSMIFDAAGNLYGTTVGGGQFNPGTIFELSPSSSAWTETILYSFTGGDDGAYPSAGLNIDALGNLYGTTLWGGPAGDTVGGVAFEFTP